MRMNDWLNDERQELRKQDDERFNQQQQLALIREHTVRLFTDLKVLVEDAVNQINADEELWKKTGRLDGQFVYSDKIVVNKLDYPAIYLTIKPGPNTIDLQRTHYRDAGRHTSRQRDDHRLRRLRAV